MIDLKPQYPGPFGLIEFSEQRRVASGDSVGEFRPRHRSGPGRGHHDVQVADLKAHDKPPGRDQARVDRVRVLLAVESHVYLHELTTRIITRN